MKRITQEFVFTAVLLVPPLSFGQLSLLGHWKIWVLAAVALTLLLSQPDTSFQKARQDWRQDRYSIWVIMGLSALSIWLVVAEWAYVGKVDRPVATGIGGLLMGAGLVYRLWAIRTLGRFFTVTVQAQVSHQLITAGPYRTVRHPSYLGAYAVFVGSALFMQAWVSTGMVAVAMLYAYYIRTTVEERALTQVLGPKYQDYQRQTWRLFPGVW